LYSSSEAFKVKNFSLFIFVPGCGGSYIFATLIAHFFILLWNGSIKGETMGWEVVTMSKGM